MRWVKNINTNGWLYSIVGKGNHSTNHVQKLKPRVEAVCKELGLQYATEDNAGRVYVNLTGGPANMPPMHPGGAGGYAGAHPHPHPQPHPHPHPHGAAAGGGYQHRPHNQQDEEVDQIVRFCLPRITRKLEKACCIVM